MIHVVNIVIFAACLVVSALLTLVVFSVYKRMLEHPFIDLIHGWAIRGFIIYEFPKVWLTILAFDIAAGLTVMKKENNDPSFKN